MGWPAAAGRCAGGGDAVPEDGDGYGHGDAWGACRAAGVVRGAVEGCAALPGPCRCSWPDGCAGAVCVRLGHAPARARAQPYGAAGVRHPAAHTGPGPGPAHRYGNAAGTEHPAHV